MNHGSFRVASGGKLGLNRLKVEYSVRKTIWDVICLAKAQNKISSVNGSQWQPLSMEST